MLKRTLLTLIKGRRDKKRHIIKIKKINNNRIHFKLRIRSK